MDSWTRRTAILLVSVALVVGGCAAAKGPTWSFPPAAAPAGAVGTKSPAPSPSPAPAASSGTGNVATAEAIAIEAFDLGFRPNAVHVASAGTYPVTFTNTGSMTHDLTFADGTKLVAQAGTTTQGTVTVPAGGLAFLCSIPGHQQAGMSGAVTVGDTTAAASPSPSAGMGDHGGPGAVLPSPNPDAPTYTEYDPAAPAVLAGTTHDITLTVREVPMTVAPGYEMAVWTFDGKVPGPVIRVHLGDTVRVHLKNPATNKLSHSVDFHASQVAWNDEMTSIDPGQEKLYEWTADYAGVWMYHCGTAPALHHIANGMYGMVIVEPKGGFAPVDREFTIVQSEWYFGGQDQPADLTKASAGAPSPDWVVFNGIAGQYKDHPIAIGTEKRVRLFVLDAGPDIDSSFHIVGTIFDTVIKEGIALTRGNAGSWGSQAVDLSPAQGAVIEFQTAEDGLYPMVTHAFNFPGRGALGLFQSGDGDPTN